MHPKSKREHLQKLVVEKNRWSGRRLTDEEKAMGFLGWHERGYLPHCDFPNLVQFVTFRLEDSMPGSKRGEWEHLLKIEDIRERRTKLEEYLDKGVGECVLRDPRIAKMVESALLHFHPDRYELLAWCVMPNHVHVLVDVKMTPLWKICGSWKQFAQTQVNRSLPERRPPVRRVSKSDTNAPYQRPALRLKWQREYWDTFMRNKEQEQKAVHYIESNPAKAGLSRTVEAWAFSSARYRDVYRRLTIQPAEDMGKESTDAPYRRPALQVFCK